MQREGGKQGVGDTQADHVKSCTPSSAEGIYQILADVPLPVSLPSEEQYSKCTYRLCFDFSKCPLTQPFHVFVYNHHFMELFNLEYWPVTVDSL